MNPPPKKIPIFKKFTVLFAKIQKGEEENKLFVEIGLRKNLIMRIFDDYKRYES